MNTKNQRIITRTENFAKNIPEWNIISKDCAKLLDQLLGTKTLLFKDKMNYKKVGG